MSQVGELADAMLLYAVALNKSLASGIAKPTGTDLARFAQGTFEGFTGTIIINQNLSRDPVFYVWGLNSSDHEINEVQPASVIWASHGGSPPLNRPPCGFDGKACPPSFVEQYLAVTLASVAVGLVLMAVIAAAIIYIMRTKRKEEQRLNLLWQIPFISLQKPNQKVDVHHQYSPVITSNQPNFSLARQAHALSRARCPPVLN
ncbi:hypothetical protein ANCDUO_09957 [Ancylostoma duodenale]|uniref:Receptor ligand binding region domain-containing protein n=1 Tax=Ancylostoma duodenale TaxID=51022 RepID=A0A0C2GS35_9BILA|nr:hypothetical protein ANCDUO_09957 [Ancylostoma duodenale]